MSLDVYLVSKEKQPEMVYVREEGRTIALSREEYVKKFGREPIIVKSEWAFHANITHNLNRMAEEAELYFPLWRPEELNVKFARELIPYLEKGLNKLIANPTKYKQFNSPNGWGNYKNLVDFVVEYLIACREHPDAEIEVSR